MTARWGVWLWFLLAEPAPAQSQALAEAERLLQEGQYPEGCRLLNRFTRSDAEKVEDRFQAYAILARFQECDVGNLEMASQTLEQVQELPLRVDHPFRRQAESEHARLRTIVSTWQEVAREIEQLGTETSVATELVVRIQGLQTLLERHPDCPLRHAALFHLGRHLLASGAARAAYECLREARSLRPAIAFQYPIPLFLEQSHRRWMLDWAATLARNGSGWFVLLTAILLIWARAWQFVGMRHLKGSAATLAFWTGGFWVAVFVFNGAYAAPAGGSHFHLSWRESAGLANPWSAQLWTLYRLGLVAIVGIVAWTLATARLRLRVTTMAASAFAALLLFASTWTLFYLEQVEPNPDHFEEWAPQSLAFKTEDIVPFVLLDPRRYAAQIPLPAVEDEALRGWLVQFIDDPEAAAKGGS